MLKRVLPFRSKFTHRTYGNRVARTRIALCVVHHEDSGLKEGCDMSASSNSASLLPGSSSWVLWRKLIEEEGGNRISGNSAALYTGTDITSQAEKVLRSDGTMYYGQVRCGLTFVPLNVNDMCTEQLHLAWNTRTTLFKPFFQSLHFPSIDFPFVSSGSTL